jgi:hypothetical protein
MRTWTRATVDTLCGGCPRLVLQGEPLQEIRLQGTLTKDGEVTAEIHVKTPKVRCIVCADGPVPADLPPLQPRSTAITATPLRPQGDLDFHGGRS